MKNPTEVSLTDCKPQLGQLVRRACAGEDIVLTNHGTPAVVLVPVTSYALLMAAAAERVAPEKAPPAGDFREAIREYASRKAKIANAEAARFASEEGLTCDAPPMEGRACNRCGEPVSLTSAWVWGDDGWHHRCRGLTCHAGFGVSVDVLEAP